MSKTKFAMLALAGPLLAAVPAQAQLLGGAGDCLCQAVGGLLGGAPGGGLLGNGPIVGNVTGSVTKTLDVAVTRSIDSRGGSASANAGITGSVSSVANAAVGANGLGKSIGLAGSSSTHSSANQQAGIGIAGVGTNHVGSLAGQVGGAASAVVTKTHGGEVGNGSLTGTLNAATSNALAVTKSHGGSGHQGGSSSSIVGTLNSASNAAVNLTKTHGSSGPGGGGSKSLTGSLNSAANGAVSLTKAGGASDGGSGSSGQGPSLGSLSECLNLCSGSGSSNNQGSSSKQGAGSGSKAQAASPRPARAGRERDRADRKDLWWPQHTEGTHREGRLQDH